MAHHLNCRLAQRAGRPDGSAAKRCPGRGSRRRGMRKRYRVLMFAALVAALVVPVGYALSVESTPVSRQARHAAIVPAPSAVIVPAAAAVAVAAPIAIHTTSERRSPILYPAS